MRTFSYKLGIYLIIILIGLFLYELELRKLPNLCKNKAETLKRHNDFEVLILGNSHAYFGINPSFIKQRTYNAALPSQSIKYDVFIAEKYIRTNSQLKLIILPISCANLFNELEFGVESFKEKDYYIYYNYPKTNRWKNKFELFNNPTTNEFERCLSVMNIKQPNKLLVTSKGFGLNYSKDKSKDLIQSGKAAAQRHFKEKSVYLESNTKRLTSLLRIAAKHNIKVHFINIPKRIEYLGNIDEKYLTSQGNLFKQLNSKTYFTNYAEEPSFGKDDFYDADHLNNIGAKKLSLMLSNKIDNILNQDKH